MMSILRMKKPVFPYLYMYILNFAKIEHAALPVLGIELIFVAVLFISRPSLHLENMILVPFSNHQNGFIYVF